MKKFFIYFPEAFYFTHLLSEKNIPFVQILTEIQNLIKFIKIASKNNKIYSISLGAFFGLFLLSEK